MDWKRDAKLDSWECETDLGTYLCVRTHLNVAVLHLGSEELRRSASDGSHATNRAFAESHYEANRLPAPPKEG